MHFKSCSHHVEASASSIAQHAGGLSCSDVALQHPSEHHALRGVLKGSLLNSAQAAAAIQSN